MLKRYALILLAAVTGLFVLAARADYQPVAQKVVDNVYAIVGPLGQRSAENDGLNANFGFVATPKGVILIDSGASLLGAKKIEAAIGNGDQAACALGDQYWQPGSPLARQRLFRRQGCRGHRNESNCRHPS